MVLLRIIYIEFHPNGTQDIEITGRIFNLRLSVLYGFYYSDFRATRFTRGH
jgi:hypothetical protein